MADDVLRMRATVVNEEFLAGIRVMGRELGLLQTKGGQGVKNINREFQTLSGTIKRIGGELRSVVPAFGGIGLGAAGIGLAVGGLVRTFTDVAKRMTELKYASRELGMSERDIRAYGLAAQKAGVSAETMTQSLQTFKRTTDGLKYNIGGVRSELYQMGAGPVVQSIQAATTQSEKLRKVLEFRDTLLVEDPSGEKAKQWMEKWGLGAVALRITLEEVEKAQRKIVERTPEQVKAAQDYADSLADLGEAWDDLISKAGASAFPMLSEDMKTLQQLIGLLGQVDGFLESWLGKPQDVLPRLFGTGKFAKPPPTMGTMQGFEPPSEAPETSVPSVPQSQNPLDQQSTVAPEQSSWWSRMFGGGRAAGGPVSGGHGYVVGERGPEFLVPGGGGSVMQSSFKQNQGGSGLEDFTRAIKSGTYDALVEWTSWLKTGEAGGGDGGGFKTASFVTGGSGAGGATGGDPARGGAGVGTGPGGSTGGGSGPPGTSTGTGPGADPNSPEATQKGPPRNAQLSDEGGKVIDQQTMKQAEALGRSGDVKGLQTLFAQKGYRMSGPACGIVASGYTKSAGFKPPPGGAMASNWNDWAQPSSKEDINKEGRPFGSMIASYNERRYGGNIGAPLRKGEKGGHVMTIVPGTYNAKDNTAMFADQYGVRRRNIKNMDIRYAGDEAVAAAAKRRGETVATGPKGTQVASLSPDTGVGTGASPSPPGTTLPQPGAGGGPGFLAQQREKFKKEFEQNPALKEKIAALATLESEGDPAAVTESLLNRADYMGKSVAGAIAPNSKGKSFYGPLNNPGLVERRLAELKANPERMKRALAGIDEALAGSNKIDLYTDQGSGTDPNMIAGGTGVNRKGGREVPAGTPGAERYNNFGGGPGGHRGSIAWRARMKAAYDAAEARKREQTQTAAAQPTTGGNAPLRSGGGFRVSDVKTDRIDQSVKPPQVNGSVAVTVNSNGTKASADTKTEGDMFQETKITQHKQMEETSMLGAP